MTMRITIKNEDVSRVAVVRQVEFNPAARRVRLTEITTSINEVAPGASLDVWLHQGRRVVVEEKL